MLGIILATLIVSILLFSLGYTIINGGFWKIGNQNRYFDYQDF